MEDEIRLILMNLRKHLDAVNADVRELQRLAAKWPNGSPARVAVDVMLRELAFFEMYQTTVQREVNVDDTEPSSWALRQGPGGPRFDRAEVYQPSDSQPIVDPSMLETRIDHKPEGDQRASSVDWKMFHRALETPAGGEELIAPDSNRVQREDDDVENLFADMPTRQEAFPEDAEDTRGD